MTEPFDTTGYTEIATDAADLSMSYDAAATDAYMVDDTASLEAFSTQASTWDSFSTSMDYVASDPTDASAWSDAWSDASTASSEAWNNHVDAYVAGDTASADAWLQASQASEATADATWNSWDAATTVDTTAYDTTAYDTTSYDTTSYDTTSYDAGVSDVI